MVGVLSNYDNICTTPSPSPSHFQWLLPGLLRESLHVTVCETEYSGQLVWVLYNRRWQSTPRCLPVRIWPVDACGESNTQRHFSDWNWLCRQVILMKSYGSQVSAFPDKRSVLSGPSLPLYGFMPYWTGTGTPAVLGAEYGVSFVKPADFVVDTVSTVRCYSLSLVFRN